VKAQGRVAVLTAPRSARIESRALPAVGPRQVRVRLEGCGVCGSNLPVWEGRPWFTYPFAGGAPGHEGWGCIDAVGDEVSSLRPGDRVAALSYNAFAEYDLAEADSVVRLPTALDGQPFPGEALGCAMNVFQRSDIQRDHTVAIIGIGFLGALLTNLAARRGARVVAISRRPFALEVARRMGAHETLALGDHAEVIGAMREITGGSGCPRVIEVTGHQGPLDLAGELTAERGRLVIAGYHQDGSRQINLQLWNWRGLDVINAHERDPRKYIDGIRAAIDAMFFHQLEPEALYTDRFALEELPRAFGRMQERDGHFLKALLKYD
jgi:threonine dehydrogenase-like Zn-dependent dehydrogenase